MKGKFNSTRDSALYEMSLEGSQDDDIGSVGELGWFGLFNKERVILEEDSQGFVTGTYFLTDEKLREAWLDLLDQYGEFWNADGDFPEIA